MEELETAELLVREWEIYVSRAEALLTDLEQTHRDQGAAIVRRCLLAFTATLESHRARLAALRAGSGEPQDHNKQRDAGENAEQP